MWILSTKGFISLVQDRKNPKMLQVRARDPQDIKAHFPRAKVVVIDGADYRYRARVNRRKVADTVHAAIMGLSYDSHFKDVAIACSPGNADRYEAYYGVWTALAKMQDWAPYASGPRASRTRWEDEDDFFDFREETE
jgi:hypothetical protein